MRHIRRSVLALVLVGRSAVAAEPDAAPVVELPLVDPPPRVTPVRVELTPAPAPNAGPEDAPAEPSRREEPGRDPAPASSEAPPPMPPAGPPLACPADAAELVAALVRAGPGPRTSLGLAGGAPVAAIDRLLAGDPDAAAHLPEVGYALCTAPGQISLVAPEATPAGQPVLLLRAGPATELIVEVPHPRFDTLTLEQGLAIFEALSARALLVSSAHRCASAEPSPCSGRTSVCGGLGPYPISDVAHDHRSGFHELHVRLAERFPSAVVLSLHGSELPRIVVSDGTRLPPRPGGLYDRLLGALAAAHPELRVTACHGGDSEGPEELCGTTNVQGRHLNGSLDACGEDAPSSSGRFLHLEQPLVVRRAPRGVIQALAAALGGPDQGN